MFQLHCRETLTVGFQLTRRVAIGTDRAVAQRRRATHCCTHNVTQTQAAIIQGGPKKNGPV